MSRQNKPAVFFDRDGVLNIDRGYTYRSEEFEWMPGAKECIKWLNDQGWWVFVITNQSGVGRGYYREADVEALHAFMNRELADCGARIDAFYHCPHHPEAALDEYRKNCECRKPEPGMILRALKEWAVDETKSFVVGDKESDLQAAAAAGVRGYRFAGGDLREFIGKILFDSAGEGRKV